MKISPSDQKDLIKFLLSQATNNEERWEFLKMLLEDGAYDPKLVREVSDELRLRPEDYQLERKPMSRTITVNGILVDLDAELEENRKLWKSLPKDKKNPVFEMVRSELPAEVQEKIKEAFKADPKNWWVGYHFGWGMGFRNLMRDKGFGEKYWPVDNLDDIYTYVVEDALELIQPEAANAAEKN